MGTIIAGSNVIGNFQNPDWVMVAFSRSDAKVLLGAFCYARQEHPA
jgi:hypothetical protein